MTSSTRTHRILFGLMMVTVAGLPSARSEPFATAFTYQAQLNEGSGPLNGSADLRFELFAVDIGGAPVGTTVAATNITVTDGLVAERLDFGVDVFDGGSRWLEVSIRTPHDPSDLAPFTILNPRQPISPIPYALQTRGIFVDDAGKVSIGVQPVLAKGVKRALLPVLPQVSVADDEPGGTGLLGESTATTGDSVGLRGKTASFAGRGVEGIGPGEGVLGEATAAGGTGVRAKASAASGATKALDAENDSTEGIGIHTKAMATTGATKALEAENHSTGGTGVKAKASAASGSTKALDAENDSTAGIGIHTKALATTGATKALEAENHSTGGTGVMAKASATSGATKAMDAENESTEGIGIQAKALATSGATKGIYGLSASTSGEGVCGEASAAGGTGVVGKSVTEGIRGEATATSGQAVGIRGMTASPEGAGVIGCGGSGGPSGPCDPGIIPGSFNGGGVVGLAGHVSPGGAITTAGVAGWSDTLEGRGVYGIAPSEGVRGEITTFGGAFGVLGMGSDPMGPIVRGVYGEVPNSIAVKSYGVHGRSLSNDEGSAGVLAEGNGNGGPPTGPKAAALEIRNGAIRVSGDARPAGTIPLPSGGWASIQSCDNTAGGAPTLHAHTIGFRLEVPLQSELIVEDSIILATVELEHSESPNISYSVHVKEKHPGVAIFVITMLGRTGGECDPPSGTIGRAVHYLIINPCSGTPAGCDTNPRSTRR